MKDHRDFADFYEASLQFFYEAGTAIRLSAGIQTFRYLCMAVVGIVTLVLWGKVPKPILLPSAAAALYWFSISSFLKNQKYKVSLAKVQQEAINELVWIHERAWRYTLRSPKMKKEIKESGLFSQHIDYVHEHGCIAGPKGMSLVTAVKVNVGNFMNVTQRFGQTSRKTRHRQSTFSGFFIAMEFPRAFQGRVILRREAVSNITMNHAEFDRVFQVQTANVELAHEILTPFMLDQLASLDAQMSQNPFTITFKDSCVYIALPWDQDLFAPAFDDHTRWQAAHNDSRAIELIALMAQEILAEPRADKKRKSI